MEIKNQPQKGEREQTPELAFDYEEEAPPSTIETSSSSEEAEPEQQVAAEEKSENHTETEKIQSAEPVPIPVKATTSWHVTKGATRILEQKRVPTKRLGIDIMNVYAGEQGEACGKFSDYK